MTYIIIGSVIAVACAVVMFLLSTAEPVDTPKVIKIAPRDWEMPTKFERKFKYRLVASSTEEAYELESFPKLGDEITVKLRCTAIDLERETPSNYKACCYFKEVVE